MILHKHPLFILASDICDLFLEWSWKTVRNGTTRFYKI